MAERRSGWSRGERAIVCGVTLTATIAFAAFVVPPLFVGNSITTFPEMPIGIGFAATEPRLVTCPRNSTYPTSGCFSGDYVYNLTIFDSTVTFENVEFEVTNSTGNVVWLFSEGGFSVINETGTVQASSTPSVHLGMTGPWNTYASWVTGSSPLTSRCDILIDMGVGNPAGAHLSFLAIGLDGYTGTTGPLPLP
ncbi:MAG TPA: hypothetical protein VEG42_00855 [Thermoplasmata archaeon]|nr:hypothetical protein [Thermoplasmata archaeon]